MRIVNKNINKKRKRLALLLCLLPLLFLSCIESGVPQPYFPDPTIYKGRIKPSTVSQTTMDSDLKLTYEYWKGAYLTPSGSTPGGYYIASNGGTGAEEGAITVSEAQGFGMLIIALMGKFDSAAQEYFDGMYKFFRAHPSETDSLLMAWEIITDGAGGEKFKKEGTATDGDLDIAYALLLANSIWGSDGSINYLEVAKDMINNAIKGIDVGLTTKRTTLGDWDPESSYSTRPSDWMTGEFHAFEEATGDPYWGEVVDTTYSIAEQMIQNYSVGIGLVPDFVLKEIPEPAYPKFLEFEMDGEYYNNACRVPMRVMLDVAHYETSFAIGWMQTMAHWIVAKTGGNPEAVVNGYYLKDGKGIRTWSSPAFVSPFIVAATVDEHYQNFVNKGWEYMSNVRDDYYNDCINLMCMLMVSDNWWKPQF